MPSTLRAAAVAALTALLAACTSTTDPDGASTLSVDPGAAPVEQPAARGGPAEPLAPPARELATSDSPPPRERPRDAPRDLHDPVGLDDVATLALIGRLGDEHEPRTVMALDGSPLAPMPVTDAQRAERENARLAAAQAWRADLDDEQAAAWFGRRLAYEGRYHDAVLAFTTALQRFPESERLLRHRGHRFITLRRFERAEADLRHAARIMRGVPDESEPDGQPNAADVPRSTRHGNVLYHLGLSLYLQGRFTEASARWVAGLENATNDDSRVSMAWWAWLSERRAGVSPERAAALLEPIHEDMDLLENHDYHALLMLAKGQRTIDELLPEDDEHSISASTRAYGVSVLLMLRGETERARELWARIVQDPNWAAFGHIAAEAELARRAG